MINLSHYSYYVCPLPFFCWHIHWLGPIVWDWRASIRMGICGLLLVFWDRLESQNSEYGLSFYSLFLLFFCISFLKCTLWSCFLFVSSGMGTEFFLKCLSFVYWYDHVVSLCLSGVILNESEPPLYTLDNLTWLLWMISFLHCWLWADSVLGYNFLSVP